MREGSVLGPADRALLLRLQCRALHYFLDNQTPHGLMLDRQSNHGPRRPHGLCSTTATGMGFIALALASAPPYRLIEPGEALRRVSAGLRAVRDRLPHDHGVVPHFIDSSTEEVVGNDYFSTVETAWVVAGALWAAAYLQAPELAGPANDLYDRVDWDYWTAPEAPGGSGLLRHGKEQGGRFLGSSWDRLNGETAFMYVLGAGAGGARALPASAWSALQPFYGWAAGRRFNNADLGLFVFQYGLDLLDLQTWSAPGEVDLVSEAAVATAANRALCRAAADRFTTFERFWGLSSGDGPGEDPGADVYRCYAPSGPIDGTAHITATLASIAHDPGSILENVRQALGESSLGAFGRYGFSSLNLDKGWSSRDIIGIDLGAAILALDNFLVEDRVREVFHRLPCVQRGLERFGFTRDGGGVRRPAPSATFVPNAGPTPPSGTTSGSGTPNAA
jgi:hypothetical protein